MEKENVEKLLIASNNLIRFERKLLFTQFPQEIEAMRKKKVTLLSDIKRYEIDLKEFPSYAETVKLQTDTNNRLQSTPSPG